SVAANAGSTDGRATCQSPLHSAGAHRCFASRKSSAVWLNSSGFCRDEVVVKRHGALPHLRLHATSPAVKAAPSATVQQIANQRLSEIGGGGSRPMFFSNCSVRVAAKKAAILATRVIISRIISSIPCRCGLLGRPPGRPY